MLCRRCMVVMITGSRYEQKKGQKETSHQRYFECRKCYDRVYNNTSSFQEVLARESEKCRNK